MKTPTIVSPEEWEAACQEMLAMEKALTRARDALAAERRRMPWLAVDKDDAFEGPQGPASLLDLFDGRRQLIVYRAFYPQTPPYQWWSWHDEYGDAPPSAEIQEQIRRNLSRDADDS